MLGDMIYSILYRTLFAGIQQKGVDFMGKDLKGKELGVGICQRKDEEEKFKEAEKIESALKIVW